MAAISEHLNHRPFQLAVTNDFRLPIRKWRHLGTIWAVSHLSAIHAADRGSVVRYCPGKERLVYELSLGEFIAVNLGG